ncbi:MAG: NAD-dependent epimerase/dehydratase family protein [Polyangiaceae bacterium]|nr:NAD-dependent epimerase/dehydratase family protein [Polyangiaceae bacterium]
MADETILITGANGIVGCELARALVRRSEPPALRLLVRGDAATVEAKAQWLLDWIDAPEPARERIQVLRGDVAREDLGLPPGERARLESEVTGILHAAACTSFSQTAAQGETGNVLGTRNALELAKRCRKLDRFGLVSTAYVAGTRRGEIDEDDLEVEAGFCNEYERSKARAELEGRKAAAAGLPVATYRLGVVVGRLSDGHISRMSGVYPVWRIFHRGLMAMIPGDEAQAVDLIPSDYAAAAIAHLFGPAFRAGANYHVCAGADRSLTLGELLPAVADCIEDAAPGWKAKGYPEPASVDGATFASFADTVELVAHVSLRATVRQMRLFTEQLDYPKRFSIERFERDLAGSGLELPHAREWLGTMIAHGVHSDWRAQGWEAAAYG